MQERPTIETNRLILRPFTPADAPEVQWLAGDKDIAATTQNVPHPYEDGMAERWIETHQGSFERGDLVNFAITLRYDNSLIGAIGLRINQPDDNAELGYWIGKPYWNMGYCTEAAEAVVHHAFAVLALHRVYAQHFKSNAASGRVMQKIGMSYEGYLKQHVKKWGVFEDMENYGLLRSA